MLVWIGEIDKMKHRQYIPIKFGNILAGLSLGILGAHYISEALDPHICSLLGIILFVISILFWSGERDIYKSENDQTDGERSGQLIVAVLLGIVLVCIVIVQVLD